MISLTGSSLGSLLYLVGSFNSKSIYSYLIKKKNSTKIAKKQTQMDPL